MSGNRITTYADFFPFYLREHSKPTTRAMHYCGTAAEIFCLGALLATGNWWWLLGAFMAGYGFAWVAHFFIEKNKPATFTYPLWSYIADHHMAALAFFGRLKPRLRDAGVAADRI